MTMTNNCHVTVRDRNEPEKSHLFRNKKTRKAGSEFPHNVTSFLYSKPQFVWNNFSRKRVVGILESYRETE